MRDNVRVLRLFRVDRSFSRFPLSFFTCTQRFEYAWNCSRSDIHSIGERANWLREDILRLAEISRVSVVEIFFFFRTNPIRSLDELVFKI